MNAVEKPEPGSRSTMVVVGGLTEPDLVEREGIGIGQAGHECGQRLDHQGEPDVRATFPVVGTPVAGGVGTAPRGGDRWGCRIRLLSRRVPLQRLSNRRLHASSHLRHASAQMRQCSCISACWAHSALQLRHA